MALYLVDAFAIFLFFAFWFWIWRCQRDKQDTYDLSDNLKDTFTNKASAAALVYIALAGLTAWYVVRVTVAHGDPSNVLLTALGIFVVKGSADRAVSAWGNRAPDRAPPPERDPRAEGDDK